MSKKKDKFSNLELDKPKDLLGKKEKTKRRLEIFGLPKRKQRNAEVLDEVVQPVKFKKKEVLEDKSHPTEKVEKLYIESRAEKAIRVKNLRKKRLENEKKEMERLLEKQRSEEAKSRAKKNMFRSVGRFMASAVLPVGIMLMRMGIARSNPFFIFFMAIAFILQLFFGTRNSLRNFWRRY